MGFPTPLAVMFRTDLSDYVKAVLTDKTTQQRGIFDIKRVSQMIDDHEAGRADYHKTLWQMLVLEEWFRKFIDSDG